MSLTDEDQSRIAAIVTGVNRHAREQKTFGEYVMRFAVSILSVGVVATATMIFQMRDDLRTNIQETKYLREELKDISHAVGGYSNDLDTLKEEFDRNIAPLERRVLQNEQRIDELRVLYLQLGTKSHKQ